MKGEIYNPGQLLKKEDLDHAQFSVQDAIGDRLVDVFSPGVLYGSQESGESRAFEITPAGGLFINVGSGVAFAGGLVDSSDTTETGGERIRIPADDVGIGDNYQRNPGAGPGSGTGTGPFFESADGLGSFVSTPQSTLTQLVPVTDATTNYIWVGYLHAIDSSVFSLHKATSARLYPRGIDGYDIIVTTSASVPIFNGNANYLLVGTVVTSGGLVTVIDQSTVVHAKTKLRRVGIKIDSSVPPATYSDGQSKFLDDHINALGQGPGPTVNNPHNMTVEDLGVAFGDVDLVGHRKNHHSKGIVGSSVTTTSSLFPRTDNSTPVGGDIAMVFAKQLTSGEELVLEGFRKTNITPVLLAPLGSAAAGDTYVSFGPSDTAGQYAIFVKLVGNNAVLDKRTPVSVSSNEFLIAIVDWDGLQFTGGGGVPNVTSDERIFGQTSSKDLQKNSVITEKINALAVTTAKIDSAAVTNAKMAVDSVSTPNIQALAVTEPKLDNSSVSAAKIQTDAVTTAKIQGLAVTEPKIADDAVQSRQVDVADGTTGQDTTLGAGIKTAHIQNGAITSPKLDANLAGAFVPTGGIIAYGGLEGSIPAGWVPCDGRSLDGSLAQNAALFAAIGTIWGGTGFLFNVPDFRGVFLRMINTTSTGQALDAFKDPGEAGRKKRDNVSPATGVGSYQTDMIGEHNHSNVSVIGHDGGPGVSSSMASYSPTGAPTGFNESRPKNAYVFYLIKL
jgi:microcystin-dependent protein